MDESYKVEAISEDEVMSDGELPPSYNADANEPLNVLPETITALRKLAGNQPRLSRKRVVDFFAFLGMTGTVQPQAVEQLTEEQKAALHDLSFVAAQKLEKRRLRRERQQARRLHWEPQRYAPQRKRSSLPRAAFLELPFNDHMRNYVSKALEPIFRPTSTAPPFQTETPNSASSSFQSTSTIPNIPSRSFQPKYPPSYYRGCLEQEDYDHLNKMIETLDWSSFAKIQQKHQKMEESEANDVVVVGRPRRNSIHLDDNANESYMLPVKEKIKQETDVVTWPL